MNTLSEEAVREKKNALRIRYRALRKSTLPDIKDANEAMLCEKFLASESYRRCGTLLLYSATPEEADITRISKKALFDGKAVAYPRCDIKSHTLTFHYITSLSQLSPSSYGLYEPDAKLPVFDTKTASDALCIVPGVVFDICGHRIGMGGGYYDRFLSGFKGLKYGAAFSDFIIPNVPNSVYDIRLDAVITEGGERSFEKH